MKKYHVYGIGNPLIDILSEITFDELSMLGLRKGIMSLIDEKKRRELLDFLEDKEKAYVCGGACPNTIIALSMLGLDTALSGRTGKGKLAKAYQEQLKSHGVRDNLVMGPGSTGSSIVLVTPDKERTMNTHLGVAADFGVDDLDLDMLEASKDLYFTGYMWNTQSQKKALLKAVRHARMQGVRIVFDMADPFLVSKNRSEILRLVEEYVDIAFANKDEALALTGEKDPELALKRLSSLTDLAVVKLGRSGSIFSKGRGNAVHVPANQVEAIDTTGAGDIYAAGFLYGLHKEFRLVECAQFASFLASRIVQKKGSQFTPEEFLAVSKMIHTDRWNYL